MEFKEIMFNKGNKKRVKNLDARSLGSSLLWLENNSEIELEL